jgi:hypothetical protein
MTGRILSLSYYRQSPPQDDPCTVPRWNAFRGDVVGSMTLVRLATAKGEK